jgi:hypothetical protein
MYELISFALQDLATIESESEREREKELWNTNLV